MMKMWLTFVLLLHAYCSSAQTDVCTRFNDLNTRVRNQQIAPAAAQKEFRQLLPLLEADYYRLAAPQPGKGWVFPLRGYNSRAAGGQNGSGYLAGRYSYWQGNAHGGHPAHDIFILDKDQNCMDDRTGKAVDVLSCTNGIVVATETQWEPGSPQRGGNYVVVFSPEEQRLFYYAHNQNVLVQPGDRVTAGSKLAEVGRTGANAAKKRSPTHLHLMVLKLNNGLPVPDNPWVQLKNARQIP